MPITIQEIIASDTISQLVDKTNFNFDQLLLNGGGPAGPFGPAGPIGPAGGRGPKGTTWYDDPSTTSPTDPNTIIVSTDLRKSDYYLDFAGDVWEYDGTSWNQTNIDLEGPPGPSGASGGFSSYFGQNFINKQNTVLATPVGSGGNGATSTNEGIPTVLIGGAASNTSTSGSGFLLTDAYQIPDILATTLASDVVSLLVHQKNNSADAILLMGGNADPAENYSQGPYTEFSKIRLQADDALNIEVPKPATNPTQNLSTVGFNIIAPRRGMQIFAGGQVNMTSGGGAGYGFVGEDGNFNITVDNANTAGSAGSQFQVITKGSASASTRILSGRSVGNTAQSPPSAGGILLDSKYISIVGTGEAKINRSTGPINLSANPGGISLTTKTGNIELRTESPNDLSSQLGNINIVQQGSSVGARANIIIENRSTVTNSNTGGDIKIIGNSVVTVRRQTAVTTAEVLASPSIVVDFGTTSFPEHTRLVGQTTYSPVGQTSSIKPLSVNNNREKVNYYYDATLPAVSGAGQTLMQMGEKSGGTNLDNGAVYSKWINSENNGGDVGVDAPSIRIGKGNDYTGAIELAGRADNYLGSSGKPEWWNLNQKQVMWSVPEIISRDSTRASNEAGYDNANIGSATAGTPSIYAYDTARLNGGFPSSALIAKLEQPFIGVTFAPGVYGAINSGGTALTNNQDFALDLSMPVGTIAGSRYEIDIQNRSLAYYAAGSVYKDYWGTIKFKVPIMRAKLSSSNTWKDWVYQDYEITAPQANAGGNTGTAYITRLAGVLTWNGAIRSSSFARYTSSTSGGSVKSVDVQMGWSTGGLPETVSVINLHGDYIGA